MPVILLGFNNGRAGKMTAFAYARRGGARLVRRADWVRASAAAAVGFRTKARGRRIVRRVPRGVHRARFLLWPPALRLLSRAVTRRQARGALGAPLKPLVEKVVTGPMA
jgi:hypothetical protein